MRQGYVTGPAPLGTEGLLAERGKTHGDYSDHARITQNLKAMVKGERYFEGQVWVDDRDFQIVKTYGKGVGIVKKGNEFPKFETYREQIDGKYWFPTYTRADDTLHFPDGSGGERPQRISMLVRYQDYKRFAAESTITYGDDEKK